jgi:hypothetical protein
MMETIRHHIKEMTVQSETNLEMVDQSVEEVRVNDASQGDNTGREITEEDDGEELENRKAAVMREQLQGYIANPCENVLSIKGEPRLREELTQVWREGRPFRHLVPEPSSWTELVEMLPGDDRRWVSRWLKDHQTHSWWRMRHWGRDEDLEREAIKITEWREATIRTVQGITSSTLACQLLVGAPW